MSGTLLTESVELDTVQQLHDFVGALTSAYPEPNRTQLIDSFLLAYPNDPAAGSPYGTGSNLFGRGAQWKRASAVIGDILFDAPKREFLKKATELGVRCYGYMLTDPQSGTLGGQYAHIYMIRQTDML
jgi:acetylcholinesterase